MSAPISIGHAPSRRANRSQCCGTVSIQFRTRMPQLDAYFGQKPSHSTCLERDDVAKAFVGLRCKLPRDFRPVWRQHISIMPAGVGISLRKGAAAEDKSVVRVEINEMNFSRFDIFCTCGVPSSGLAQRLGDNALLCQIEYIVLDKQAIIVAGRRPS